MEEQSSIYLKAKIMKKYQVIERCFDESRILATFRNEVGAKMVAKIFQEEYKKKGLSNFFYVRAIIIDK